MRWIISFALLGLLACGDDASDTADAITPTFDAAMLDGAVDATTTAADASLVTTDAAAINADASAVIADAAAIAADAMPVTRTFTQGMNSYAGTRDTTLRLAEPSMSFGALSVIGWDADGVFGLLRFGNIFGSGATQIPAGATIVSATLTMEFAVDSDMDATLHDVLVSWNEGTTYNGFGVAAGVTAAQDYDATVVAQVPATGAIQLDVTSSITTWLATPAANFGWLFLSASSDGAAAYSSESTNTRPTLTVTYQP